MLSVRVKVVTRGLKHEKAHRRLLLKLGPEVLICLVLGSSGHLSQGPSAPASGTRLRSSSEVEALTKDLRMTL